MYTELDEFTDPERILGTTIGDRYLVQRCIATGGMGVIYLAWQVGLGRHVVLKVIRADRVNRSSRMRFGREAKNLSRLSHANVVSVYDHGMDRATGLLYLVMEHVGGMTVRQFQRQRGRLPIETVVAIARPLVGGLAAIHRLGLVHRDIKASNVMLSSDDGVTLEVKIVDFGLSKQVVDDDTATLTEEVVGSHRFLAPEVFKGEPAGPPADVYSTGVLLYELLTGRDRVHTKSPYERLVKSVHGQFTPLDQVLPEGHGVPPAFAELIHQCLHPDPSERPPDGRALAERLLQATASIETDVREAALSAERATPMMPVPTAAAIRRSVAPAPEREASGPPAWALLSLSFVFVVIGLLAALGAVYIALQDRTPPPPVAVAQPAATEPDLYREWALAAMRDGDYDLAVALLSESIGEAASNRSDILQLLAIANELRDRSAKEPEPEPDLEPEPTGVIVIAASPQGVGFEVPGIAKGYSPSELQGVPVGRYTVRFFAGDNDDQVVLEELVEVVDGEIALVYVDTPNAPVAAPPASPPPVPAEPMVYVYVYVPDGPDPAVTQAGLGASLTTVRVVAFARFGALAEAVAQRKPGAVLAPRRALTQLGLVPTLQGVDASGRSAETYAMVYPKSSKENRIFRRPKSVVGSLDIAGEAGTSAFVRKVLDLPFNAPVQLARNVAELRGQLFEGAVDIVVVPADQVSAITADAPVELVVRDAPNPGALVAASVLDVALEPTVEDALQSLDPELANTLGVAGWNR